MKKMRRYVHECAEGLQEVYPWELQFGNHCEHCGEKLIDQRDLLYYMYEQLTEDYDNEDTI